MNKIVRRTLKISGGLAATLVVLLVGVFVTFNNKSVQKKLLDKAVEQLSLKLDTHVEIDSISINVFTQKISLHHIMIEDREQREMLKVERISVDLELMRLLQHKIVIEQAEIDHAKALLLKPSKDEPANYQFVIDAFKKPKKKEGSKMELDISALSLKNIRVKHNELDIYLREASYNNGWISGQDIEADSITLVCDTTFKAGLKPYNASIGRLTAKGDFTKQIFKVDGYHIAYQWESLWKKRNIMVENQAGIGHLTVQANRSRYTATVKQAHYKNDNHLPRKNTGRPKRGFFDAKHLDVIADLHLRLDSVSKDWISGELNECQIKDSVTGIDIRKLQTKFEYAKDRISLQDIAVQQKSTTLNITSGEIVLSNKKEGRPFSYSTGVITGTAYLKDISRTFAPVLKNFTLPLNVSLNMSGTDDAICFKNIRVSTNDKKLQVAATGDIRHLKEKEKLAVRFHVSQMTAKRGMKEKIISQFPVKKFMMKQLHNLGDINYTGDFSVLWKKEVFKGNLKTAGGPIDFQLTLDENTKYVSGSVSTSSFQLGKVMDMKDIGDIICQADFRFDISKPRTAKMRKEKGGKLPIGQISAKVDDSSYKKIHFRNLSADIRSDGAIATGNLSRRGKHVDLFCSFSFTNTDEMQKMKIISPKVKLHKLSDEDRQKKDQKKLEKQQQKEADNTDGKKKGFFKRLFSKKKKTETT